MKPTGKTILHRKARARSIGNTDRDIKNRRWKWAHRITRIHESNAAHVREHTYTDRGDTQQQHGIREIRTQILSRRAHFLSSPKGAYMRRLRDFFHPRGWFYYFYAKAGLTRHLTHALAHTYTVTTGEGNNGPKRASIRTRSWWDNREDTTRATSPAGNEYRGTELGRKEENTPHLRYPSSRLILVPGGGGLFG